MGIDLYYTPTSPPCQSIRVVAKVLGIDLNLKKVDMQAGEHKTPEFLKLNPQHTVPTLVDGDFVLWESRAILQYLCDSYGKNDKLYPKDSKQRASINRLLFFDLGTLYKALSEIFMAMREKKDTTDGKKHAAEALEHLDNFLVGRKWLVGDQPTIADISMHITTALFVLVHFDLAPYKNVQKWLETGRKEIPHYEIIEDGFKLLVEHLKKMQSAENS